MHRGEDSNTEMMLLLMQRVLSGSARGEAAKDFGVSIYGVRHYGFE
jgi:hypothetical protein